jgi:hypothetical protein
MRGTAPRVQTPTRSATVAAQLKHAGCPVGWRVVVGPRHLPMSARGEMISAVIGDGLYGRCAVWSLGCGLHGGAVAGELEAQLPDSRIATVYRRELPVSSGIPGEAREIAAGTGILQQLTDHITRGIDEHTDRDFDVSADPFADRT